MKNEIFEEMHQLSHKDERRYRLLMIGVKQLLQEQKENRYNLRERLKYRKKHRSIQVKEWS
ncbi:hypothetical protein [Paenibacillus sp. 1781tsa1]|uniref:hypothetical protein n=1 Tax=Paenibacillus sp. 1781tsa1 TaxID=2953810 RepID=UPI0020A1F743|nr:hypothetical protein [Paenibacillus sp. 1781tsa1]MCP1186714.1 hypothetical protein [Paenibacillus sp. 1781tsa1]